MRKLAPDMSRPISPKCRSASLRPLPVRAREQRTPTIRRKRLWRAIERKASGNSFCPAARSANRASFAPPRALRGPKKWERDASKMQRTEGRRPRSNGGSAGAQRHAARRPPEAPRPTHPGKLAARSAPRRRPAGGSPADTPRLLSRARERRRASATPLGVRRRLSLRPHPGKLAARSAPRRRPAGGSPPDTPRLFKRAFVFGGTPLARKTCPRGPRSGLAPTPGARRRTAGRDACALACVLQPCAARGLG